MTTTRTPIGRPPITQITPKAIAAFREMQKLEPRCTCPPIDWDGKYWQQHDDCAACKQWRGQNSVLCDELHLAPWQWPAYQRGPRMTFPKWNASVEEAAERPRGLIIVRQDKKRRLDFLKRIDRLPVACGEPQLECLLDDVVVGKQEMVGAIDAVCDVAQRIIGKLKDGAAVGGSSDLKTASMQ